MSHKPISFASDVFTDFGVKPIEHLHCAIDTSGSTPPESVEQVLDHIQAAALNLRVSNLTIYQFDTRVTAVLTYAYEALKRERLSKMQLRGGGGTSMRDVMEKAKDRGAKKVFFFSDGFFNDFYHDPDVKSVFLLYGEPIDLRHVMQFANDRIRVINA